MGMQLDTWLAIVSLGKAAEQNALSAEKHARVAELALKEVERYEDRADELDR